MIEIRNRCIQIYIIFVLFLGAINAGLKRFNPFNALLSSPKINIQKQYKNQFFVL